MNEMEKLSSYDVIQVPTLTSVQSIDIYETPARFYLVGSNSTNDKFRVVKIDRTEHKQISIMEDKVQYTEKEIRELLKMIGEGNKNQKNKEGLKKLMTVCAIVGFVSLMEGWYMVLVTKKKMVALVAAHIIYKIEDTSMLFIPSNKKYTHPDEARYLRTFQNIDLSSNFYFSFSYDLSNSLQHNLTPATLGHDVINEITTHVDGGSAWEEGEGQQTNKADTNKKRKIYVVGRQRACMDFVWNGYLTKNVRENMHSDWLIHLVHGYVKQSIINVHNKDLNVVLIARRSCRYAGTRYLKRGSNMQGYVANEVETEQIVYDPLFAWDLHLKEGSLARLTSFIQIRGSIPLPWSQSHSKMTPKPLINLDQRDPNFVSSGRHFKRLLRKHGSPIIVLDLVKKEEKRPHESMLSEEYTEVIEYLNRFLPFHLRIQYIPFDMANINKSSGKTSNVLHKLEQIADYCVTQTTFYHNKPPIHAYNPICLHDNTSLNILRNIESYRNSLSTKINQPSGATPTSTKATAQPFSLKAGLLAQTHRDLNYGIQRGVVRTNCIDCLDRTNTAQFVIGMRALVRQLYCLGVLDDLKLDYDSDCMMMMEEVYEEQGDTLALQYGGSQLVHRIKGYRKLTPWASSSRDIMHSLSRYYSNTFSDSEKQNSINLFLGVYKPNVHHRPPFLPPNHPPIPLWNIKTDFYIHNQNQLCVGEIHKRRRSYTKWWDKEILDHLPSSLHDASKQIDVTLISSSFSSEMDLSSELLRPQQLTVFADTLDFTSLSSVRDFMPKNSTNWSPFCLRVRRENRSNSQDSILNVANQSSPDLKNSTSMDSIGSRKDYDDLSKSFWMKRSDDWMVFGWEQENKETNDTIPLRDNADLEIFKHEEFRLNMLKKHDEEIYQKYVNFEIQTSSNTDNQTRKEGKSTRNTTEHNFSFSATRQPTYLTPCFNPLDPPNFSTDTTNNNNEQERDSNVFETFSTENVSKSSEKIYEDYVRKSRQGPDKVKNNSLKLYKKYVNQSTNGIQLTPASFDLLHPINYQYDCQAEA